MKRVAAGATVALAIFVAAWGLWKLDSVVVLLLLSFAIAAAVGPLADRLQRRGVPRPLALVAVYLVGLVLVAGLFDVIGRALLVEAPRAADRFLAAYERLRAGAAGAGSLQRFFVAHAPASKLLYHQLGAAPSSSVALGALDLTHALLDVLTISTLALILSLYWVSRRISLRRVLALLFTDLPPAPLRIAHAVAVACGDALRSALGESALSSLALALAFRLLGMPLYALPAAIASLALLVPVAGPLLAVAVAVLAGFSISPAMAAVCGLVAAAIVAVLRLVVAPRLFPVRRADPMLVVCVAMVLASAFGLAGVIIAPLVAAIVAIVARRLFALYGLRRRPLARLSALEERLHALRSAAGESAIDPTVAALVDRMGVLTLEANASLRALSRRAPAIVPRVARPTMPIASNHSS